jgi:hypothetical protein
MSDPTDTGQRNPLSSSTSHASGTSALNVTVQPEQAPGPSMTAQDDGAAPAPVPGGDAVSVAESELQAEAGPEFGAGFAQPDAAGWRDEPAATQQEWVDEPEAAQDFVPAPDPAPEGYAEYSQPAADFQDFQPADEFHAGEAAPAPGDEALVAASIDMAADEASAFVDEPAYAAATDERADSADDFDAPAPVTPSGEDAAAHAPLLNGSFPEAASELRTAARQTIAENEARQEKALALFDQVSRRFTAALEEAGVDAARLSFKVMEFAQANLKNNLELAKSYAAARSVPDIFGLHAAYITRQFQLLNAQAEELREITAKITSRSTSSLKAHADPAAKARDHR